MEGLKLDHIGPHSIRALGAMHLCLNDVSKATIMNIGCWQGHTWLTYIHNQIAPVSGGSVTNYVAPHRSFLQYCH